MLNTIELLAAVCIAVVSLLVYRSWVAGKSLMVTAATGFVIIQTMYVLGTVLSIDWNIDEDFIWLQAQVASLALFTIGGLAANHLTHFNAKKEIRAFRLRPVLYDLDGTWHLFVLVLVGTASIAAGIVYALAVGYNVFTYSLTQFLSTQTVSQATYGTMRTTISTERYVAAGYSAQFFGILLPIVMYLLWFRWWQTRRLVNLIILPVVGALELYFLTITGGRSWLLYATGGFVALVFFGPFPKVGRRMRLWGAGVMITAVLFYGASTVLMGRATSKSNRDSLAQGVVMEFYNRVVGWQAEGQTQLMRYFISIPPVWGGEWLEGLESVLPQFRKAHGFGSRLHAMLYKGNNSGSLGLTFAGSAIYNWGIAGMLLLSGVLGWLLQRLTIWYVRGTRRLSRVVVIFSAGCSLARFRDPFSLLLEGFLTAMLCYWLLAVGEKKGSGTPVRGTVGKGMYLAKQSTTFVSGRAYTGHVGL